jgi:hypothetical protein
MVLSAHRLVEFEHRVLPRIIVPILASLLLLAAGRNAAQAAGNTFVIPDSEGYGIMDCLSGGKACGRIVADAWCEAHGLGPARSFGPSSDVTGITQASASTDSAAETQITRGSVVVACAD